MHRRFNSTQRNYMIIGLCAILVIMGVGYAAFSSSLKISGTSNVTSNWDVKITDIQSKDIVGGAGNKSEPTHTDTTATFNATLQKPGDSITYDVTVTNQGNVDAKLDKITLSDSSNPAIKFETSGIKQGDLLAKTETAILTVKVSYDSGVTSQPGNLNASLTVTLDYSQAPSGYVPPQETETIEIGGQEVEIVTEGDGLYKDEYEDGRYIYKGANPNNYITFNNEEWRIMSVENDGTIKIIRNKAENKAWDENQSNDWTGPSTLNTYLNGDYLSTITTNQDKIISYNWGIGGIFFENDDLVGQIENENKKTWNGKIALMTVSEYLKANTNKEQCGTFKLNDNNYEICKTTDYLYNIVPSNGYLWTLSANPSNSRRVFVVYSYGGVSNNDVDDTYVAFAPTLYLTSDITLTGDGSQGNPYVIN